MVLFMLEQSHLIQARRLMLGELVHLLIIIFLMGSDYLDEIYVYITMYQTVIYHFIRVGGQLQVEMSLLQLVVQIGPG